MFRIVSEAIRRQRERELRRRQHDNDNYMVFLQTRPCGDPKYPIISVRFCENRARLQELMRRKNV